MAPSSASDPLTLHARSVGHDWPGVAQPVLQDVELRLRAGECVWLGGASGAGKTTLLRILAGIPPRIGGRRGEVCIQGGRAVLLLQDIESQLLCTTVEEEVGFGLRRRGIPAEEASRRGQRALDAVGLAGFSTRSTSELSLGEKARVLVAALIALEPAVLLLDEPASQLDPAGRAKLVAALATLKEKGLAMVVADHVFAPFSGVADRALALEAGRLVPAVPGPDAERWHADPSEGPGEETLLQLEGLCVGDVRGATRLRDVSLCVRAGERVHLAGANGAGKSTLLRVAAGALQPTAGRVEVAGRPVGRGARLLGRVGLLFQSPERNLFERNVAAEVAFALHRAGWPRPRVEARVAEMLELCDLTAFAARSPLRLSFGERHRVALAAVLAPRPRLLLLDEPFAGLDPASRARLQRTLAREQATSAMAIVLASHDDDPAPGWLHRRVILDRGEVRHG